MTGRLIFTVGVRAMGGVLTAAVGENYDEF
jgi:hypothetical protein